MLNGFHAQIISLKNRIEILEYGNDGLEQKRRPNALLIHGLSQTSGETLTNSVLVTFGTKLGISMITTDIKSTERLRTRATLADNFLPSVLVPFHSTDCAKRRFANKKKLAP